MSAEGIGDAYRIIDVNGEIVHDCEPATRSN
jgi:hypothetical protein